MRSARRKSAAIALAVVGVAGLSLASAAQLNVNSASLGAGADVVASCDTDGIDVDFASSYVGGVYQTTGVTLSGVAAACDGLDVGVTLAGTAGVLDDVTDTVATGGTTTISGLSAAASAIEDVAVIIHG
jgi:hypothetical protein